MSVFQDDAAESKHVYKRDQYALGFICTLGASAGYGLLLSLTQFAFQKVLKQETFKVVLDMTIYPSLAATIAVLAGLFASGEWKGLGTEMEGFKLGEASYCMTLIWTAISWQLLNIGCVGLIFEVSSVFSNVIKILILSLYVFISLLTFPLPLFEKKSPCFQFFMLIWSRVVVIADKMQINTIHVRALLALLLTRGNIGFSFVFVVVFGVVGVFWQS